MIVVGIGGTTVPSRSGIGSVAAIVARRATSRIVTITTSRVSISRRVSHRRRTIKVGRIERRSVVIEVRLGRSAVEISRRGSEEGSAVGLSSVIGEHRRMTTVSRSSAVTGIITRSIVISVVRTISHERVTLWRTTEVARRRGSTVAIVFARVARIGVRIQRRSVATDAIVLHVTSRWWWRRARELRRRTEAIILVRRAGRVVVEGSIVVRRSGRSVVVVVVLIAGRCSTSAKQSSGIDIRRVGRNAHLRSF